MTLTKLGLTDELAIKMRINHNEARDLVELFFDELGSLLEAGRQVHLSGFGNFALRDKRARPGRNPKTGKDVTITERRVVTFHAGQKLRRRVNGQMER